jgi:hypothetical protein
MVEKAALEPPSSLISFCYGREQLNVGDQAKRIHESYAFQEIASATLDVERSA